jgi:hypothetical protein
LHTPDRNDPRRRLLNDSQDKGLNMLQLIYTSVATVEFSEDDLNALLFKSRKNNEKSDITGMLLYDKGTFLQIIEGPEDAIKKLIAKIEKDDRHNRIITISQRAVPKRDFEQWRMGFAKIQKDQLLCLPGFEDFFDGEPCLSHLRKEAWLTRRILLHFRDGMWHREKAA